jgi:cytochrome P450
VELDRFAKRHIESLLDALEPPTIDVLDLCRRYWMPVIASVIGIEALPYSDLVELADCTRALVEGNGLQGDREAIERLARANDVILALIRQVATTPDVPLNSALGYFLSQLDMDAAIDIARTFIIGGIDTGSSALALQAHLLASDARQRARFLAMSQDEQQAAMTELASKEAPTLYTPRFAVRDVRIDGVDIAAGSFLQLAMYGLNSCANPDFDVRRGDRSRCPMHNNESLPFGHARHKCPGETLARHLMPIFLDALFRRFEVVAVRSYRKEPNTFARSINELLLDVETA